jgi:hypothetical protein
MTRLALIEREAKRAQTVLKYAKKREELFAIINGSGNSKGEIPGVVKASW